MSPTSDLLRVRASVAPLLGEPRIATALTSELLAGHTLRVLGQSGDWWHVEGEDGYAGWTHAGYVEAATGDESDWPVTSGARVRRPDGRERSLPFGARVSPEALVLSGEVFDPDERTLRFPATREALAHTAEQAFTGAPYRWGGVTPWGTDCSGFMQAVARMHGVSLPRDAWQQAAMATRWRSRAPSRPICSSFLIVTIIASRTSRWCSRAAGSCTVRSDAVGSASNGGTPMTRTSHDSAQQCTGARRIVSATR
jgi:hypothetical protein